MSNYCISYLQSTSPITFFVAFILLLRLLIFTITIAIGITATIAVLFV